MHEKKTNIDHFLSKKPPGIQIKETSYYDCLQNLFIQEADCQAFPPKTDNFQHT
jgi:hypothetical protein